MATQWLSLSDYSKKYDVSVSTLRRRIKQNACEFIFDDGRYELKDRPLSEHQNTIEEKKVMDLSAPPQKLAGPRPSQTNHLAAVPSFEADQPHHSAPHPSPPQIKENLAEKYTGFDPSLLIAELKKAYAMILNEKEQQIMTLKEEVADLRTLVRVLEESNQQLKTSLEEARSIDSWLSSLDK